MTKKDTQRLHAVSSQRKTPMVSGEPRSQPQQTASRAGTESAVEVSFSVTCSPRYIDSRMKQFCLR